MEYIIMTEVRIEVNEPYKIYYYNAKYTFKWFSVLAFFHGFGALMLFLNRANLKVSLIGMCIYLLINTIVGTAMVGHISSFHHIKNIKEEKLLLPETIEGNFSIADEAAYYHITRHNGGYLYRYHMAEIIFKIQDDSNIKLFTDTDTIQTFIDLAYGDYYLEQNLISYDEALRPFVFKKIVYGACSKIIFECVFEYDETLIKK